MSENVKKQEQVLIDTEEINWGDEAIIEEESGEAAKEETGVFVAPTQGIELALSKIKNSIVAGLHCAAGEYEVALRLLQKQIALMDYKQIKEAMKFTAMYNKPRLVLLTNMPSLDIQLLDSLKQPIVPINTPLLQNAYNVIYIFNLNRKDCFIQLKGTLGKH